MIQLPASVRILRGLLFAFAVLSFLNSDSVVGAESVGYEELQRQAASAHAAGKRDEAIALMTRAIGLDPKQPRGYFLRARLCEEYRELDKAIADYDQVIKLDSRLPDAWQNRGSAHFKLGHIKESIADFDKVIELRPDQAPHHWQRGISLYYAGRFEEGRKQFESHQTVNPDDVENAVWHFLCVTRASGLEKARAALIPIQGDPRVPMMEVHALFAGKLKPEDVLKAAGEGEPPAGRLNRQLFYAHLYLGLYFEAVGDEQKSREHISKAAGLSEGGGYMGDVAHVHLQLRTTGGPSRNNRK
jgi:lipoprotein NlpI